MGGRGIESAVNKLVIRFLRSDFFELLLFNSAESWNIDKLRSYFLSKFPEYFTQELLDKINYLEREGFSEEKKIVLLNEVAFIDYMLHEFVVDLHHSKYDSPGRLVAWMLIDSTKFGAFAYSYSDEDKEKSFDFIGINIGLLCILYDHFTHILSSSTAFVGFGKWYEEDSTRSTSWLMFKADSESPFTIPLCPLRAELAKILTVIAVRFIVLHESAHLYNGHVDWLRNNKESPRSFMDDFPEDVIPKDHLIHHYFEIDADDCALQMLLKPLLDLAKRGVEPNFNLEIERRAWDIAFGTINRITYSINYLLYVMLRCTDPLPWDEKAIGLRTHPRELIRMRFLLCRFWEVLNWPDFYPSDFSTFGVAFTAVKDAEEDLANMVTGRQADHYSFEQAMRSSFSENHIREVGKIRWRLIPELSPYVRGDKYPKPLSAEALGKMAKPYSEL